MTNDSLRNGSAPEPGTFILRGGRIVSMDPAVGDLVGDVLIEDAQIAAIGPHLDVDGVPAVDVGGKVVMPGFVDSHRHLWEAPLRGRAADASLGAYFGWLLREVAPALTAEGLHRRHAARCGRAAERRRDFGVRLVQCH